MVLESALLLDYKMPNNTARLILIGFSCTLSGVGLARFAFTPLIPELILAQWFSVDETLLLGATNLAGYLLGALIAIYAPARWPVITLLRVASLVVVLSFVCCFSPLLMDGRAVEWFALWRFLSGMAGSMLMVLAPALVLSAMPAERKTTASTLIFCGIGAGALLSGTLIPYSLTLGLSTTWLVLGTIAFGSFLLLLFCSGRLSATELLIPGKNNTERSKVATPIRTVSVAVWLLLIAYALDATGFVPHTLFWADYLIRERSFSSAQAGWQWTLFGAGAVSGTILARIIAKQSNWHSALIVAFTTKALAVAVPLLTTQLFWISLSSFWVGAMTPGIVMLVSGRLAELVRTELLRFFWGLATLLFAVSQAVSAYSLSGLYRAAGTYLSGFAVSTAALVVATALLIITVFSGDKPDDETVS